MAPYVYSILADHQVLAISGRKLAIPGPKQSPPRPYTSQSKPQISPFGPQIDLSKPQISRIRPEIRYFRPRKSNFRPRISFHPQPALPGFILTLPSLRSAILGLNRSPKGNMWSAIPVALL